MKDHAITHTETSTLTDKISDSGNERVVRPEYHAVSTHNLQTEANLLNCTCGQKLNINHDTRDLVLERDLKIIKCSLCNFSSVASDKQSSAHAYQVHTPRPCDLKDPS